MEMLYEGELLLGNPSGFGRLINGRAVSSFVGYFANWFDTVDDQSLGLYFENL